ncbi:MAG: ImmA/IrrE family metallo-endopeptidase [Lachnospiraceae bacterium]|jgi:hypothetical protein|nr:ImmA/IrrE family metallo-endopeptidase [Lachnospiraceae bacterium]MCI9133345.1 ImmA/IrrE family metallo-endopeptidase [Lachnospiraceae bacterium]
MNYEELQIQNENLFIKEMDLSEISGMKGFYYNENIAIHNSLSATEKSCVLAEELGHHYTTYEDILNQDDISNRKQELRARLWAYNKMIGLQGIIRAYEAHLTELEEIAEYLDVTLKFLIEALQCYRSKYSPYTTVNNYTIFFEPCLTVVKII